MPVGRPPRKSSTGEIDWAQFKRKKRNQMVTPDDEICDIVDAPDAIPLQDTEYAEYGKFTKPMNYSGTHRK